MPLRRRAEPDAQRRFATLLFTDIVASTELAADLGDRGWRELIQRHHAVVRRLLRQYGGREIDTAGDGFFATFEQPARAVRCASAIVTALGKLHITIRAGLHAGEVEQIGDRLGGIAVHLGSRVAAAANPGEVLVTGTLREMLAGSELRFVDRGQHTLKGVPGEWRLFAVDLDSVREPVVAPVPETRARPERARRPTGARLVALVALVLVLLGAAAAAVVLLVGGGGSSTPLPGVDMVGRIDPGKNRFEGTPIRVGARPTGIVSGAGSAWVTNYADRTVSRIDLGRGVVEATPAVGGTPTGVTFGAGSVWMTTGFGLQSGGSGSVVRLVAANNQIAPPIELGSGVQGIAFDGTSIWVTNANENTVTPIDPDTSSAGQPVRVGNEPEAVAADANGIWVANTLSRSVTHLSTSGRTLGTTALRSDPSAVAVGEGGVWVASRSGATVTRLDPATGDVEASVPVAASPNWVAAGAGGVWVTMPRAVQRIDPQTNRVAATVRVLDVADGVAVADGAVWVTVHAP
jgi:YVTN family beta-propeller protein